MQIGCVEIEKRKEKKKNSPGIIYGKDNGFLFERKEKKGRRKVNQERTMKPNALSSFLDNVSQVFNKS